MARRQENIIRICFKFVSGPVATLGYHLLESLEHAQTSPPDKTDTNGYHRTRITQSVSDVRI